MSTSSTSLPVDIDINGFRIALFGISANPPTGSGGHLGIVKYLISTRLFDEIWILPVYKHIYVSKNNLESFEHRLEMCKLCFLEESTEKCRVRVLNLEEIVANNYLQKFGKEFRMGTIDVLNYLNEIYSNKITLHLVLGADTYNDLIANKWKESEK
jgi:nicotinic acid mononucleotide adenylyltransferase